MGIQCSYPNFKPAVPIEFMIDIWCDDLADYSYQEVYQALKVYKTQDTSGFAPTVEQLIDKIYSVKELVDDNSEMEMWNKVYKAICNSGYNANAEFYDLPEICQKVIGSPNQLHQWSQMELDDIQSVVQSNFMRSYRSETTRQKQIVRLPQATKQSMGIETRNNNLIETKEE